MEGLPILLTPEKADPERQEVINAWIKRGGPVKLLGKYWIKDEGLTTRPIAIYGNQTFSLVLEQIYNLHLISPDDSLIAKLDRKWTKRNISLTSVGELNKDKFPVFAKPVIPKLFLAGVFQTLDDFKERSKGLSDSEQILVSEIVEISAEARSYIMDATVKDFAIYEGSASIEVGINFLKEFVSSNIDQIPRVVVIDLAFNNTLGWFVLEFNACWGAGLNSCNAENVIDCIIEATELPNAKNIRNPPTL